MDTDKLIGWLKSQRYIYEKDGIWIVFGEATDTTEDFEKLHKWEFSRNRMIEKTIKYIEDNKYDVSNSKNLLETVSFDKEDFKRMGKVKK